MIDPLGFFDPNTSDTEIDGGFDDIDFEPIEYEDRDPYNEDYYPKPEREYFDAEFDDEDEYDDNEDYDYDYDEEDYD